MIVIHEMPGLTEGVIRFGQEVVDAGFTVLMPHLFGKVGAPWRGRDCVPAFGEVCVRREFTLLATGRTAPIATWLRSLARDAHAELGGPGVGALGMCFTGGFALAMMVDAPVEAPVLAQPAAPFAVGATRAADLGLSAADLAEVKHRAVAGCQVLGLRFREDGAVGTRFTTLRRELGDAFIAVEFDGEGHSTLTEQRQPDGVRRVLDFFTTRLTPSASGDD